MNVETEDGVDLDDFEGNDLKTIPVKIYSGENRKTEKIPIEGEPDIVPATLKNGDEDTEAILVSGDDVVKTGDGYGLILHGGNIRAYGYQSLDGEICMAGQGIKKFFKKVVNKAKELGTKAVNTVGKAAKKVGTVALNAVNKAAQDFVNSGAADHLLDSAVNFGAKKLASNLLKGRGYEAGLLEYDFDEYYDDFGGMLSMCGCSSTKPYLILVKEKVLKWLMVWLSLIHQELINRVLRLRLPLHQVVLQRINRRKLVKKEMEKELLQKVN